MPIPNDSAVISASYVQSSARGSIPTVVWAITSAEDLTVAVSRFINAWEDNIVPAQNTDVRVERYHVEEATASYDYPGTAVGAGGTDNVEPAVALLISKGTGIKGRAYRGRCYLPWSLLDSQVDENGVVTPSARDAWQARFTAVDVAVRGAGARLAIHHKQGGMSEVTDLIVSSFVATQRRRMRK